MEEEAFFVVNNAQDEEAGRVDKQAEEKANEEMELAAEEHGGNHQDNQEERAPEELTPLDTGHFLTQVSVK